MSSSARIPNVSTRIVPRNMALPETGSCFDTTVVHNKVRWRFEKAILSLIR